MFKRVIKKIGLSANPLFQIVTKILRFPLIFAQFQLLNFRKECKLVKLIKLIQRERGFMMWPDEMAFLFHCAVEASRLEGDFAEIGVSSGGSAKLILEAIGGRRGLHLFDTFEGLPRPKEVDEGLREKQYACGLESVEEYLHDYSRVFFYKGIFPVTTQTLDKTIFSFVHLDVDLYQSTLDGLEFFYPRMQKQGLIIIHDYSILAGTKQAVKEFFVDKSELIIELPTSQCLIIKI